MSLTQCKPPPQIFCQPKNEKKVLPNPQLSVPKEIWRLADYIYKNGLDYEGLFVTGGDAEEMEKIRDCLDEGRDFEFGGLDSFLPFSSGVLGFLLTFPFSLFSLGISR